MLTLILLMDPRSGLLIKEPRLDPSFTFETVSGPVTLTADDEMQNALGQFDVQGREWRFFPKPEWGDKTDITVTLPLYGPSQSHEASLECTEGVTVVSDLFEVKCLSTASEKKRDHDPDASSSMVDMERVTVKFHVVHQGGKVMSRLIEERRRPTPEEEAQTKGFPDSGVVSVSSVQMEGEDGVALAATFRAASGMSSPIGGYAFEAYVQRKQPGFRPRRIRVGLASGYGPVSVSLNLKEVSLKAAK